MSPLRAPIVELELLASDSAHIKTLSVTEGARGQGVGTRLLTFAERSRGPQSTSVIGGDHDAASPRFFERAGFGEAARHRMVKDGWQTPNTEWILLRKS